MPSKIYIIKIAIDKIKKIFSNKRKEKSVHSDITELNADYEIKNLTRNDASFKN